MNVFTLNPLKDSLAPGVKKARSKDEDEENPFEHHVELKFVVRDSPGEQKDGFNIKHDKYQGINIVSAL